MKNFGFGNCSSKYKQVSPKIGANYVFSENIAFSFRATLENFAGLLQYQPICEIAWCKCIKYSSVCISSTALKQSDANLEYPIYQGRTKWRNCRLTPKVHDAKFVGLFWASAGSYRYP